MSDLMPFKDNSSLPDRPSDRDRGPLPAPPWWTAAGAKDRRAEENHTLAVRQEVRAGELAQIRAAGEVVESTAKMEALSRISTEAKFRLEEAHRRSLMLAGEDPVLQAQMGVLDDTLFQAFRSELIRRGSR